MDETELADVVDQVRALVEANYIFPEVAAKVSRVLAAGLASGRYPAGLPALATAVTADLQSVNGDKHLRLKYHEEAIPPRAPGDDTEEYAAMARWAGQTCGGVACTQRLAGNVGYLDLQPVLFPAVLCAEVMTAAASLLATTDALIIDCATAWAASPVWSRSSSAICGTATRPSSQECRSARAICSGRPGRCPTFPAAASARTSRCTC
jgi:hypothetical protein